MRGCRDLLPFGQFVHGTDRHAIASAAESTTRIQGIQRQKFFRQIRTLGAHHREFFFPENAHGAGSNQTAGNLNILARRLACNLDDTRVDFF